MGEESGDLSPSFKKPIRRVAESNSASRNRAAKVVDTSPAVSGAADTRQNFVAVDRNIVNVDDTPTAATCSTFSGNTQIGDNQMRDYTEQHLGVSPLSSLPQSSLCSSIDGLCKMFCGEYIDIFSKDVNI